MKPYESITREVDRSRKGPATAAFFDFDGTLLAGFSVFFFLWRHYRSGQATLGEVVDQLAAAAGYGSGRTDFSGLLESFALSLAGLPAERMQQLAREVFLKDLAGRLYPETRALLRAHQQRGHTVVLLSSATQFQVSHAAEELEVDEVICTQLEVKRGRLSGFVAGRPCYGEQKCAAAVEFAQRRKLDLSRSWFYSDGAEDLPLLERVGHPRPINPDRKLAAAAREREWPVRSFSSRRLPSAGEVVRTGLVYGSLLPSFLLSAPALLRSGSRRDVINRGIELWTDFSSEVAGLDVHVTGEEHLWSQRPAVFIFNHQSATDVLIVGRLLRRDFTGVAKKEIRSNPLLGPTMAFADAVFIDRQGGGNPAETLAPAVEKLQAGLSIAIAPEGQRSPGYRLGPFRKGAFHIAMQARVPLVPIVIANASDALPKSGVIIHPATIHVTVLPPVSTTRWTAATLDRHVEQCREMFLRELRSGGRAAAA